MSIASWIYQDAVLPWCERPSHQGLGKRVRAYARRERATTSQNRDDQWVRLRTLINHAYESTVFYRQRFDLAGVKPEDIHREAELRRIPPLTRDDLRNHLAELRSDRFSDGELTRAATGGTTDTPVPILRSRESVREKVAVQWQFNRWAGFRPGDSVFYLWGARQDYLENPSWRWRLYDRGIMRRVWAPTSILNDSVLESYRESMNRSRPRVVYAYPTPLALFCDFLLSCGRPYHRPATAICTAEPLLPSQRTLIEAALGCAVFEHYGSREFGMIAAECEYHRGLHLNTASSYVEYEPVPGSEADNLHEILVTDLLNFGMPLIRYRVNDCVRPGAEACPCGRGLPLMGRIEGRTTDAFRLANGDVIPGVALTNRVLQVCPGIKKVQVIQDSPDDFRIRYVPGAAFDSSDLEMLGRNLQVFFGNAIKWQFHAVGDIERERSGKTRFCISNLQDRPALAQPIR